MPHGEHQEPAPGPRDDTIGHEDTEATFPPPSSSSRSAPSEKCDAACCREGDDWLRYQYGLTSYSNGPGVDTLLVRGKGAWTNLRGSIIRTAEALERVGLAHWYDLSPDARKKLKSWSPVAKELWESDFSNHQEALVQVWLWRYVEENLFFFSNSTASVDGAVACSSPVWEHVRTLTRDLQPVRTLNDGSYLDHTCRIQFNGWRRITEHLVRRGLGLKEFATPAVLMAHCKKSLRQLFVNGETQLPDLAHDGDWRAKGPDYISSSLRQMLEDALRVQYCIHGLEGTYTLRFTPIGSDSDRPWGFPFDDGQMQLFNPPELKDPKDVRLSPVQLVCAPMLALNKRYDEGFGKVLIQEVPMDVVTSSVYVGDEAKEHTWPNCREDVEERRAKRRRVEADAGRETGQPTEEQVEEVRVSGKSKRIKANRERAVKKQQLEQQKAMEELQAEQLAEADALLAGQQAAMEELLRKQETAKACLAKQQETTKARLAKQQEKVKARLVKEQQAAAKALRAR
ncbi:hypothetical protein B0I37DRAFT_445112 [Chaetomium sp. MPI-CAGE-AT-0009]|nr:hypothetical protein B0I37DRAFT_445112 [Chaetomium sp. MPI-CAGE-AT-0009]